MEYIGKETYYNGVLFRSKTEAKWARFFDLVRIEYDYEPITVTGWNGYRYKPDFYLPAYDKYAEVKTSVQGIQNETMANKLCGAIDYESTPISKGLLLLGAFPFDVRIQNIRLKTKWLFWHKGVCSADAYIQQYIGFNKAKLIFDGGGFDVGDPLPPTASPDIFVNQFGPGNYITIAINETNEFFMED